MVTCSHCGAKINRLAFCSPSHKVQYHRKNPRMDENTALKARIKELEHNWLLLDEALKRKIRISADTILEQVKESLNTDED